MGTSLTIKIEGYVDGVLRVSKTDSPFTVNAGENYRNIVLSRTADEVILSAPATTDEVTVTVRSGNSYTLGNGGATTFYVSKNTDITNQVKQFIPASAATATDTNSRKYTWNTSGQTTVDSGSDPTLTVNIDDYLDVETAFSVQVRFNGSNIGTAFYAFNGDDITNQIKSVVDTAGNLEKDGQRYAWNDADLPAIKASNTTNFYDVDDRLEVAVTIKYVEYTWFSSGGGGWSTMDIIDEAPEKTVTVGQTEAEFYQSIYSGSTLVCLTESPSTGQTGTKDDVDNLKMPNDTFAEDDAGKLFYVLRKQN